MKIAFVVLGSRGDVQPFVAIAKELIRRGIPAVILAQRLFQPWIEREGIQFVDLPGHLTKDMSESLVAQALTTGNMKLLLNDFYNKERLGKTVHQVLTYLKNDKDVTLVVCGPAVTFLAPMMHYLSDSMPGISMDLTIWSLNSIVQSASSLVVHAPVLKHVRNLDFSEFSNINMVKAVLPPQRILPHYFACSHNIMPRPSDWPADILVGGNVLYENRFGNNLLSPETEAFLDDGDAPVYIGFGSMAADLCTDFFAFINEVVEHSAQATRFIVKGITGKVGKFWPGTVVTSEPHNVLFSQCSVIVHHGGAGKTAEAARGGKPVVICTFCTDQPLWAEYIAKTGAGINAGPFCSLTGKQLSALINKAQEPKTTAAAKELGYRMREERGLENACDWLTSLAGGDFALREELTWLEWFWTGFLSFFGFQFLSFTKKKSE
ncbi:UDP-Glycosyltransferase/glycogen phosphorylase [Rhizoclosmatium globosum]|uniref:UDP-Glycosyltransferase/glycogen phosphorylase n=1 Tax=Rhizoclosmatium globosum TaxID=329046 RepID=A0A1Y2B1L2_9FUNG|nr:UDP-Glycosyltransferase/glycogen phosphorylase [Rhizoclosmatium globosum]|eukprot:ORY28703.1 UDP-Glycosyltransferase/glycogen phosphorylase [Rhizoclosmatium globosum]